MLLINVFILIIGIILSVLIIKIAVNDIKKIDSTKAEYSLKNKLIIYIYNSLVFLAIFKSSNTVNYIIYLTVIEILLLIALIDFKLYIIPIKYSHLLLIISITKSIIDKRLFYSIMISTIVYIIYKILKTKNIGFGDIKLFIALILLLDKRYLILAISLSFIFASICSLYLIYKNKLGLKDKIPFAPFIYLGFTFTILLGEQILFYLKN